jgi:hypothetical protein
MKKQIIRTLCVLFTDLFVYRVVKLFVLPVSNVASNSSIIYQMSNTDTAALNNVALNSSLLVCFLEVVFFFLSVIALYVIWRPRHIHRDQ